MLGGNEARLGLYRVPLLFLLTHEICRLKIEVRVYSSKLRLGLLR